MPTSPIPPAIAFYYPGPMWHSADAIKNLLLFFDGIGLLVPEYMLDRPEMVDPSLAIPLRERGLLHLLKPEELVDQAATESLAAQMADIIHSGVLDEIATESDAFHEISMSRLGYMGDSKLAAMIVEELKARGLARDTEDGVSIPMHGKVRNLILVLLAQILRPYGSVLGLKLEPITDRPQLVTALTELLSHHDAPSAGHVVTSDMSIVGVDLSTVPLDEVLSFRSNHLREHRRYAESVKAFVRDLGALSPAERQSEFEGRVADLEDAAADLRRRHRQAWKKAASFAFGAAGAAWTATKGDDPFGALLIAVSLATGYEKTGELDGPFSFLFSARADLAY